jgi:TolB-like protein
MLRHDTEIDFLAYSLADAIGGSLSAVDSLIVRSSLVAEKFEGASHKTIAVEAAVDFILAGTLVRIGDQLRFTSQLVDAQSGALLWSDSGQFALTDVFQLQDRLASRIVHSLVAQLTDRERRAFGRDVPVNAVAYANYLRANQIVGHRTTDNAKMARDLYLCCLKEDPSFAPAWACLGRVYRLLDKFGVGAGENLDCADRAFQRAFALNPGLTVAHNFYTSVEADMGHAKRAMVRLLERAALNRNDPELFAGLVQSLRYCGELRASLVAHRCAKELDPHIVTSVEHTHFLICDYQETLDLIPPEKGYYLDAMALASLGRVEEARARLIHREELAFCGPYLLMRSLRALLEGKREDAMRAIDELEASRVQDPETTFCMARHVAYVGDPNRAINMLSAVIEKNFVCDFALAQDPWLESVRAHPHFANLLQRAAERRRDAHAAFIKAGGESLLKTGTDSTV